MVTYEQLLNELKKEMGPIAKIFLERAMNSLGITEINKENYKDVLEVLKMNSSIRDYISEVERRLEKIS
ncbi:MAG: hypothetical protein DSO00_01200 [Archaeoglobi archaeon]|jgi:uncharacterized protein YjfI (DUF2170 family)|nr:MAG: hypothetical protein DSO00_01200 [Archaeoglobi archaeon]